MSKTVDILFDGPPNNPAPRFVEVEDSEGKGINFGVWLKRDDGYWVLRIPDSRAPSDAVVKVLSKLKYVFENGIRVGSEVDSPEGSRCIKISDTLVKILLSEIQELIDAN